MVFENSLISLEVKEANTIAQSSTEVLYRSLAALASELITWLVSLLKDFGITLDLATVFYDNKAAIHIASTILFIREQNT